MEKKKVLEVYRRYLKSLDDQNANIGDSLAALNNWLNKAFETPSADGLKGRLKTDAVYHAIKALNARGINSCKQMAGSSWNGNAVQSCYERLNSINNYYQQAMQGEGRESMNLSTAAFGKFLKEFEVEAPWLYIYMHIAYSKTAAGQWFTKHREMMEQHRQVMQELEDSVATQPTMTEEDELRLSVQAQILESCKED